jgi:hypothetical protein
VANPAVFVVNGFDGDSEITTVSIQSDTFNSEHVQGSMIFFDWR